MFGIQSKNYVLSKGKKDMSKKEPNPPPPVTCSVQCGNCLCFQVCKHIDTITKEFATNIRPLMPEVEQYNKVRTAFLTSIAKECRYYVSKNTV